MARVHVENPGIGWPQGIWAAVPTPFREDETVDFAGIAHNVAHYRDSLGLAGIFCNGLMGEGWSLSGIERRQILEATVEAAGDALLVGVVTTWGSTTETLELSRHAAASGADHIVLMRPPGLFSTDELGDLVRMVSDAVDCRIVLFDSEAQSGGYPAAIIHRLAEEGRIHAVKCTRHADAITALRDRCGGVVAVCDPYEAHALANLTRFDQQVLYADPEPYLFQSRDLRLIQAYFEDHRRGAHEELLRRHTRLEPLRRAYERWIQTPLMLGQPINAALKHWCRRSGLAVGPVRRPLRELTANQAAALDADLDAAFASVRGTRGHMS